MVSEGVLIREVVEGYPISESGIKEGEKILEIDGVEIENVNDFIEGLNELESGDELEIVTNVSSYDLIAVDHPESDKGYLGLSVGAEKQYLNEEYGVFGGIISWLSLLVFWVFAANMGVGLFNLLPMGPLDGGKMFHHVALKFFKKEKMAKIIWMIVSFFCLGLIVISLAPFIGKLLSFVFGLVVGLI